jgi:hypothetical protein
VLAGTIAVSHRAGRQAAQVDPRTCLTVVSQSGTYQITGGTGRYASEPGIMAPRAGLVRRPAGFPAVCQSCSTDAVWAVSSVPR